jgi:hypothetical protein
MRFSSNKRFLIIVLAIGAILVIGVIIMTILAPPTLTLRSNVEGLETIKVNGQETKFTDGMKIPYTSALTIEAQKEEYYPATWSLDPNFQRISEFTIELARTRTRSDHSANAQIIEELRPSANAAQTNEAEDALLKAATTSGTETILDFGQALSINIKEHQSFEAGTYRAYIVTPKPPLVTDPALVVIKQTGSRWHVLFGPGTNFDSTSTADLPPSLVTYMQQKGYINE